MLSLYSKSIDQVFLSSIKSLNYNYISNCDIGVNLIIFDKNIHKNEVKAHIATPPHPKSKLHEVLKTRAPNRLCAARVYPLVAIKPSTVPS